MKKIYSILMLLIMACGCVMSAAAPASGNRVEMPEKLTLNEKGRQMMKQMQSSAGKVTNLKSGNYGMRKVEGENGVRNYLSFDYRNITWLEILDVQDVSDFAEFPYYVVVCMFGDSLDGANWNDMFMMPMFWPAKTLLDGSGSLDPVSVDEFVEYCRKGGKNTFRMSVEDLLSESYWPCWPYVDQVGLGLFIGGQYYCFPYMYESGVPSELRILDFGSEDGSISADWEVHLKSSAFTDNGAELSGYDFSRNCEAHLLKTFGDKSLTDYPGLYLVGTPQGWDIYNGDNRFFLEKVSDTDRIYRGYLTLPAGVNEFRFYGRMKDWEQYSVGASANDDEITDIDMSRGTFTTGLVEYVPGSVAGKGNWRTSEDFAGGLVEITVDLDSKTAVFSMIERDPEFLYMRTFDVNDGSVSRHVMTREGVGVFKLVVSKEDIENLAFDFIDDEEFFVFGPGWTNGPLGNFSVRLISGDLDRTVRETNCAYSGNTGYKFLYQDEINCESVEITVNTVTSVVSLRNPASEYDPTKVSFYFNGLDDDILYRGVTYDVTVQMPRDQYDNERIVYGVREGEGEMEPYATYDKTYDNGAEDVFMVFRVVPNSDGPFAIYVSTENAYEAGVYEECSRKYVMQENIAEWGIRGAYLLKTSGDNTDQEAEETLMTDDGNGKYTCVIDLKRGDLIQLNALVNGDITALMAPVGTNVSEYLGDGKSRHIRYFDGNPGFLDFVNMTFSNPDNMLMFNGEDRTVRFTLDPATGMMCISSPDYNPVLKVEKELYEVIPYDEFTVKVQCGANYGEIDAEYQNVSGDLGVVYYGMRDIYLDDQGNQIDVLAFYPNGEGEGIVTLTDYSTGMKTTFRVVSRQVIPEEIVVDRDLVEVREGEFSVINVSTNPYSGQWIYEGMDPDNFMVFANERDRKYILGLKEGEYIMPLRLSGDGYELRKEVMVRVLPKDAVVAEHIGYSYMKAGEVRGHYVSSHNDGSAAMPEWTSSDPSVAEVDAWGNVRALKSGSAVVTADCGAHTTMFGVHVETDTQTDSVSRTRATVYTQGTTVIVAGVAEGETVNVYDADGKIAASRVATGSALRINIDRRGAFLLTAGNDTFKVML